LNESLTFTTTAATNKGNNNMKCLTSLAVFALLCNSPLVGVAVAQTDATELRAGATVERQMTTEDTHNFTINLEQDQMLESVVQQRGIDVVITVFAPDGKSIGAFDSPNGTSGPEPVTFMAEATGKYRIEISTFARQDGGATAGRYEIKITNVRAATPEEAKSNRARQSSPAKALALVDEALAEARAFKSVTNRATTLAQTADLLWAYDEPRARALFAEAIEGVRKQPNATTATVGDHDAMRYGYGGYDPNAELRQRILQMIVRRDPQLALDLLPNAPTNARGAKPAYEGYEQNTELALALEVAAKNPQKAIELAERSLTKGVSPRLLELLARLSVKDGERAAKLASAIAGKLASSDFNEDPQARGTTMMLLRLATQAPKGETTSAANTASKTPLLSEAATRELIEALVASALDSKGSGGQSLMELQSLMPVIEKYVPTRASLVRRKLNEINQKVAELERLTGDVGAGYNPEYPESNDASEAPPTLDETIAEAAKTSTDMQPWAYMQAAQRAIAEKDFERARKIIKDHIPDANMRDGLNAQITQQLSEVALSEGKIAEVRRMLPQMRTGEERAFMLARLAVRATGDGDKKLAQALLDEAREMMNGQAENYARLNTQIWVARAYLLVEPERGFEMFETAIRRLNELAAAAAVLDGFMQQGKSFDGDEMMLQSGAIMGNVLRSFEEAFSSLARTDFDRAKAAIALIQRPKSASPRTCALPKAYSCRKALRRSSRNRFTDYQSFNSLGAQMKNSLCIRALRSSGKSLLIFAALFIVFAVGAAQAAEMKDRFATFNNTKVHYLNSGKGKEALIFVHGWTCDATFWRAQTAAFPRMRVIALDLPGHGQSDKPQTDYTMDYFARSIEAVMRDARVERAVIVGHSMGTPVAREFYRLYPQKTLALVIVDGALRPLISKEQRDGFVAAMRANYKAFAPRMVDGMLTPVKDAELKTLIRTTMLGTPEHVGISAMAGMNDEKIYAKDPIKVPVLAILAKSPFWTPDTESFLRSLAPNLEFHTMEGVSHFLMMEKPQEFNRTLQAFLVKQKLLKVEVDIADECSQQDLPSRQSRIASSAWRRARTSCLTGGKRVSSSKARLSQHQHETYSGFLLWVTYDGQLAIVGNTSLQIYLISSGVTVLDVRSLSGGQVGAASLENLFKTGDDVFQFTFLSRWRLSVRRNPRFQIIRCAYEWGESGAQSVHHTAFFAHRYLELERVRQV
jgi:pimeloyl-ACP methyl ester carboxylesterase